MDRVNIKTKREIQLFQNEHFYVLLLAVEMPQEFHVLQCYSCFTFQVHQVKKSSNKWNCKLCGEKQSIKKVNIYWTRFQLSLIIIADYILVSLLMKSKDINKFNVEV